MTWQERFLALLTYPLWGSFLLLIATLVFLFAILVILFTPLYVLFAPDNGFKTHIEIT